MTKRHEASTCYSWWVAMAPNLLAICCTKQHASDSCLSASLAFQSPLTTTLRCNLRSEVACLGVSPTNHENWGRGLLAMEIDRVVFQITNYCSLWFIIRACCLLSLIVYRTHGDRKRSHHELWMVNPLESLFSDWWHIGIRLDAFHVAFPSKLFTYSLWCR